MCSLSERLSWPSPPCFFENTTMCRGSQGSKESHRPPSLITNHHHGSPHPHQTVLGFRVWGRQSKSNKKKSRISPEMHGRTTNLWQDVGQMALHHHFITTTCRSQEAHKNSIGYPQDILENSIGYPQEILEKSIGCPQEIPEKPIGYPQGILEKSIGYP